MALLFSGLGPPLAGLAAGGAPAVDAVAGLGLQRAEPCVVLAEPRPAAIPIHTQSTPVLFRPSLTTFFMYVLVDVGRSTIRHLAGLSPRLPGHLHELPSAG